MLVILIVISTIFIGIALAILILTVYKLIRFGQDKKNLSKSSNLLNDKKND